MKNKNVYVYSSASDYLLDDYINLFNDRGFTLHKGTAETFESFVDSNPQEMQLDTETNVTDHYSERELYVVQLGNIQGTEQHVFDFEDLTNETIEGLKKLLKSETIFYAHNAKFEYIVLYKALGIKIKNFLDTYLMAKVITSGLTLAPGFNSLAGLLERYFNIELSKEHQTTFTGEKMSPMQLLYATIDVVFLGKLKDKLQPSIDRWKLKTIFKIENKALRPIVI